MNLMAHERQYFRDWVSRDKRPSSEQEMQQLTAPPQARRKATSIHILNDWVNVIFR
jgi:hypothetical protein